MATTKVAGSKTTKAATKAPATAPAKKAASKAEAGKGAGQGAPAKAATRKTATTAGAKTTATATKASTKKTPVTKPATPRVSAAKSAAVQTPVTKASTKASSKAAPKVAPKTTATGAGKSRKISPEQALANTRGLLDAKREHARQPQSWQAIGPSHGHPGSEGFQSPSAQDRAEELHAGESHLSSIQGSVSTRDRHNQGKRDSR